MLDFFQHLFAHFTFPVENPIIIFSLVLFIILLAPLILKKFNIPGIIGLIIAGVIIGPYGFHILEGPDNSKAIALFAQIGLLYIMFIAGLDLDLNQFKNNKNKSLLFGFFTFVIPMAIGYPVCRYLLDFDFNASFLTASMFATHTLVTYPIVSKLGVSKNKAVAATVGGTILTDTAVLIILAVIVGNAEGNLSSDFWIRLGIGLTLFSAFMFYIIPKIAQWFFTKLESEKHSHFIFVLSIVFLAGFLAEIIGIEPIIGAFIAGLALNKLIPSSSALMNRIDFIGNALFVPFFLISVGMLVDVNVIFHGWGAWIIAGSLTAVAICGKWLAAWFTQLAFKFSKAQRGLIFGLSGAHAAATLAVVKVGYEKGILDANILNGTIILILVACIIASFATEKAARKLLADKEDAIEDTIEEEDNESQETILMPIANVNKINQLLEFAVLIKDKRSVNPIAVLTVVSNNDDSEVNIIKAQNRLEKFVVEASASETDAKILTTIDHNVASGIARVSREIIADIIILGWPTRAGFFNKLIGNKMHSIVSKTFKTTYICHFEKPLALHKRIVLAAPPCSEEEIGFELWVTKIGKLAQELSNSILLFANQKTQKAINNALKRKKLNTNVTSKLFTQWEDFLIVSRDVNKDDLIMLVAARKGGVSHLSILDEIPSKLERYFADNNYVVVYPQSIEENVEDYYTDVPNEPLTKGIEAVQKLGKELGSIFTKRKEDNDQGDNQ